MEEMQDMLSQVKKEMQETQEDQEMTIQVKVPFSENKHEGMWTGERDNSSASNNVTSFFA